MEFYDIIGLAIFHAIQHHINSTHSKRIVTAPTAQEAFVERERLKMARRSLALINASVFGIIYYIVTYKQSDGNTEFAFYVGLGVFIYCFVMMLLSPKYHEAVDGISVYTKDEYLNDHPYFALYLRAFYNDMYVEETSGALLFTPESQAINKTYPHFSEQHFVSILERRISVCAVGMTREVEHPVGATRVYLNDDTWQKDVSDLMAHANEIYILIDNRESCIWEIEHSKEYRDKTLYIIDDVSKYMEVREHLSTSFRFPTIPPFLKHTQQVCISFIDGKAQFKEYINSEKGYMEMLNVREETDGNSFQEGFPFENMSIQELNDDNDTTDTDYVKQLEKYCNEITLQCPIKIDEIFLLTNCEVRNEKLYFYYDVNEDISDWVVFQEQAIEIKNISMEELSENNRTLWNVLKHLNYPIVYVYKGSISGRTLEV